MLRLQCSKILEWLPRSFACTFIIVLSWDVMHQFFWTTMETLLVKQAVPNLNSLRGFEVIDEIKYILEEACPLIVSS
ncbi:hypothetical protein CRYUN_Cryun07bG0182100 [Craigia yunnanensis]